MTRDTDAVILLDNEKWAQFLSAGSRFGFTCRYSNALGFARRNRVVWSQAYLGISRNVDMPMFKLREKWFDKLTMLSTVEALKNSKTVKIETVKGAGYRLLVNEPKTG